MYFDFEDYRPDISPIGSAISTREGALMSLVLHGIFVLILIALPTFVPRPPQQPTAEQIALQQAREREARRFVFVAPRVDLEALKAPPRAEDSDKNRTARNREKPPNPTNPLPYMRGNSPNRVEGQPGRMARAQRKISAAKPPGSSLSRSHPGKRKVRAPQSRMPGNARPQQRSLRGEREGEEQGHRDESLPLFGSG